jgi:hypothetical protein
MVFISKDILISLSLLTYQHDQHRQHGQLEGNHGKIAGKQREILQMVRELLVEQHKVEAE